MGMKKHQHLFFGLNLTEEQQNMVKAFEEKQILFCNAKAGTGKTTISVALARLQEKDLYYIMAPVVEGELGFLPGDVEEKTQAYCEPLHDALCAINEVPEKVVFSKTNIDNLKNGNVWVFPKPHNYMRGTNLKDCTVIIDEAQNFTVSQLRKVLTRIHDSAKVIVIGHDKQCDIAQQDSGFTFYMNHYKNESYCEVVELTHNFRGRLAQHADEVQR